MADKHPNIALLERLDLRDLSASKDLCSEDFVWHFFNPELPEVQGDYSGLEGLGSFFRTMHGKTGGSFQVHPVSIQAIGNELVVTHVKDTMVLFQTSVKPD